MEQGNNDASKEAKRIKGKRTTGETLNSTRIATMTPLFCIYARIRGCTTLSQPVWTTLPTIFATKPWQHYKARHDIGKNPNALTKAAWCG